MGSSFACTSKEHTLDHIECIKPEEWTQNDVTQWLKLAHSGEFKSLIQPFKQNKISGLTFVRLTTDSLKHKLGIKQFGLRDSFIVARDQVLEEYNHNQQNPRITTGPKLEQTVPMNTTITIETNNNTLSSDYNDHLYGFDPISVRSNTYSPDSFHQLSLSSFQYSQKLVTSSDILFSNHQYLYMDLCRIVVQSYCKLLNNVETQQQNTINTLCFNYYFEYTRHCEQFGYDLWSTLRYIDIKTIQNGAHIIRGFTGDALLKHMDTHLPKYAVSTSVSESLCSSLIKYSYLRLAAITNDRGTVMTRFKDSDRYDTNKNYFKRSWNHLYQFENDRHIYFLKHNEPDRDSWYTGCNVKIYSETLKRWMMATIMDINDDMITVQYAGNIQKTVDRYQDHNMIKSTAQHIAHRTQWSKGSELMIYSNRHSKCFLGSVREVIGKNAEQLYDVLRIFYRDNESKMLSKCVERWSSDIREKLDIEGVLSLFIPGHNVMIWSNSRQRWIEGVIKGVVHGPMTDMVVNVRYGEYEKLLSWNSDDIKLCDSNAMALLESYKQNHLVSL